MDRRTGKRLNAEWGVGAAHALYSDDGRWYHRLTRFPGALFDSTGYVRFNTEEEWAACPQIQVGAHVHVPLGIAAIPSYRRVHDTAGQAVDVGSSHAPGRRDARVRRIIRDTPLTRRVKALHGYLCQLCRTALHLHPDRPYAEGHHLQPLGAPHDGPDIAANIVCVCPNCHVLLDYGAIELTLDRLHRVPGHRVAPEYLDYYNEIVRQQIGLRPRL